MLILAPPRLWVQIEVKSILGVAGERLADLEVDRSDTRAMRALDHLLLCG